MVVVVVVLVKGYVHIFPSSTVATNLVPSSFESMLDQFLLKVPGISCQVTPLSKDIQIPPHLSTAAIVPKSLVLGAFLLAAMPTQSFAGLFTNVPHWAPGAPQLDAVLIFSPVAVANANLPFSLRVTAVQLREGEPDPTIVGTPVFQTNVGPDTTNGVAGSYP